MPGPYENFLLDPTVRADGLAPLAQIGGYAKLNRIAVTDQVHQFDAEQYNVMRAALVDLATRARTLFNVLDYGADKTGATTSTVAIQRAYNAAHTAGGGTVFFPAGHYKCGKVFVYSNTTTMGEGWNASIVQKVTDAVMFFAVNGVYNTRWTGLGLDLNRLANYDACIATGRRDLVRDLTDPFSNDPISDDIPSPGYVEIDHCRIYTSVTPHADDTLHACLILGGVTGVWIHHNLTVGTQIKVSEGGRGCEGVFIDHNRCEDSHNFGISVVASYNGINPDDPSDVDRDLQTNIQIHHNVIVRPYAGGIFVGSDDNIHAKGDTYRLSVKDNTILGPTPLGIVARVGRLAEDWDISGNTVRNPDGAPPNNSIGIYVAAAEQDGGVLQRCSVIGNRVANFDLGGVQFAGAADGLIISQNICKKTRGIVVGAGGAGVLGLQIDGNVCMGNGVNGISLEAFADSVVVGRISGNTCRDNELSGIKVQSGAGATIDVEALMNRCFDSVGFTPANVFNDSYGIEEGGAGAIVSRYALNDLRGARTGATHVGGGAVLLNNRTS